MFLKYGYDLAKNILSQSELKEYSNVPDQVEFLSSLYAAKEAVAKALGTGLSAGVELKDICVSLNAKKLPELSFTGYTKKLINEKKIIQSSISIANEKEYSVAMVMLMTA